MLRIYQTFLRTLSVPLFLTAAPVVANAADYSGPVNKAEWASDVPSYIDMFIAVPDTMPENPPILVNIHSCGNNAGGQWSYDGFAPLREAIDSVGFIMILPQQSRNCWNVGAPESLTHDGGGDTGAIVQMVKYALEKYNGDPTRVYAMGGSGGGMATQALLAVYPEVFKAGHARAGVPAGCWAEGYDDGQQWSNSCAGGNVDKTPQEWGEYVRGINPDFAGPRPRIQLNHGNNDETISFNNFREAIEEWTNVLGLEMSPTSTDSNYQGAAASYDRQFWQDDCGYTVVEAWEALGQGHSMGYESETILEWFGLDEVRDEDPWDAQCGDLDGTGGADNGSGGAGTGGSASSTGGADTGAGGVNSGVGGADAGSGGSIAGSGGSVAGSGGSVAGSGGSASVGGTGAGGVATGTGGMSAGVGGSGVATGGTNADGGPNTSGSEKGCTIVPGPATGSVFPLGLLALGFLVRRRRPAKHSQNA